MAGASFAGMFAEDRETRRRLRDADLATSTTLVTVERLKKGEKVNILFKGIATFCGK